MEKLFNLTRLISFLTLLVFLVTLSNCSKDDAKPSKGKIAGKVTDLASGSTLSGVTVIVFDASDNSPLNTVTTNDDGKYTVSVAGGNYFLKFSKQGYESVPPRGMDPVPFEVTVGNTTTQDAAMSESQITNAGYISGKVSVGSNGKSGVLVVAELDNAAYSGVSDEDGNYTIFNVPAGSYTVKGYLSNFSSDSQSASVTADAETGNVNVKLTEGASGQFSGTFKVISQTGISVPPTEMDISLVHPATRETIPGLSQTLSYSSSLNFSFTNVPDGKYVVRATYGNDYIVVDPDYIQKFGDYKITISSGTPTPATLDIVSTSAVMLTTPTNEMSTTEPSEATTTPTFDWDAYPSTSDYVIEVTDATTGTVIWGGFTNTGGTLTKNIVIPGSATSIAYNSDGKASSPLVAGKVYRWKVFASKNNNQTGGWNLISASEDQMGLIKIK